MSNQQQIVHNSQTTNLADILERVLDKGIVIAGDIQIKLADVELLTIKIRLLIASVDKAQQIGINWWQTDSYLSSNVKDHALKEENERLEKTIDTLKLRLENKETRKKSPRKSGGAKKPKNNSKKRARK